MTSGSFLYSLLTLKCCYSSVSMAQYRPDDSIRESDQPTYGGYDYQSVGTTPSEYTCSICAKVLRDAHLTVCCGQHFCASCLTHWLGTQQGRKTCPHCRQEDFQHVPNKSIIRKVNELKIHCTNHREGCEWVVELEGLKSHLDSDCGCDYTVVMCTNEECGERMTRKDFQIHLQEECYYRPYKCEHCSHKDTYKAVTDHHYTECPEYPLACPNTCGMTGIRRTAMPDHQSSCPLEPFDCPFEGCEERISRKGLQMHMQEECYYRPYECEHCGLKDTYSVITGKTLNKGFKEHYSGCPEYPLACSNSCGVTGIRRKAMLDHQSSCPLEPLDCPFKDAGCTEKIARKEMEDHMTAYQQKHILLTFQLLQLSKQELQATRNELHITKHELQETKQELHETKQDLHNTKQELQIATVGLSTVGDTLTLRVTDFPQLRRENKAWHSPPFIIGDEVRVRLTVHASGVGRGQGSHVSVSFILMKAMKEKHLFLRYYNVSVSAIGQHRSARPKALELRKDRSSSPGAELQSEELFLKIEEANSLLVNDSMILQLKLLEHRHQLPLEGMGRKMVKKLFVFAKYGFV